MMNQHNLGTILVVDDYLPLLRNMSFLLKIAGFDVLIATSGEQALDVLAEHVPDLVISDINMSEMDGYELLQIIRSETRWATLPFIFASVKYDMEDLLRGLDLGANDYIPKPFDIYDLLESIQRTAPHLISTEMALDSPEKHPLAG